MGHKNILLRILGLAFGLAVVVGSVIGQGILRSPGVVAQATNSTSVILGLWVLGAAIAAISAFAFAELGAAVPRAGGTFAFVERAFGPKWGTFTGMCILTGMISSLAMFCFIVGEFLVRLGVGGGAYEPGTLGLISLTLFCLINAAGTRISGWSQVLLSTTKAVVLLVLIIAIFGQEGVTAGPPREPIDGGWLAIATALMVITNTYSGWHQLAVYGEELQNPGRDIPRAMIGGIAGVAIIYLLINTAMLHVLAPWQMAGSILPAADAAGVVFGDRGDDFLTLFGVVSVGAIANLYVMSTSRLIFAMARSGVLPNALTRVERNGTPLLAVLTVAAIVAVFIATGTYLSLVTTTVAQTQFNMVMAMAALYALRRREPDLPRPFRMPAYPWTWLLAFSINLALFAVFFARDPMNSLIGFLLVGALWLVDMVVKRTAALKLARQNP